MSTLEECAEISCNIASGSKVDFSCGKIASMLKSATVCSIEPSGFCTVIGYDMFFMPMVSLFIG